jgi:hypothetical protein
MHDDVVMLNPPTLIEHNNDFVVNGTILKSPPRSSNRHFNKKKYNKFSRKRHRHQVVGQMANRNHVFYAIDMYVTSCG